MTPTAIKIFVGSNFDRKQQKIHNWLIIATFLLINVVKTHLPQPEMHGLVPSLNGHQFMVPRIIPNTLQCRPDVWAHWENPAMNSPSQSILGSENCENCSEGKCLFHTGLVRNLGGGPEKNIVYLSAELRLGQVAPVIATRWEKTQSPGDTTKQSESHHQQANLKHNKQKLSLSPFVVWLSFLLAVIIQALVCEVNHPFLG